MNLKEYLISIGRLKEEDSSEKVTEESSFFEPKYQTIGDFFDLLKAKGYKKLPSNFLGANAGIWKTQIN